MSGGVAPLLSVRGIEHRYDGVLALAGVDFDVVPGSFTAVLGPNGAGKSTFAQIMAGALRPTVGSIHLGGIDKTAQAGKSALVREGVVLIPEGRRLFGQMSVEENLMLGAYGQPRSVRASRIAKVYDLMPDAVRNGKDRASVTLSGGEQQMLAVGRALMAEPRIIIIDEPSLGLAPILTERVYALLSSLRETGVAVVVFEQLATYAMKYVEEIAVIEHGRLSYRGQADDEATTEALRTGYLGHG